MIDASHTLILLLSLFVLIEIMTLFLYFRKRSAFPYKQEDHAVIKENLEQAKNLVYVLCHDLSNHLTVIVGTSNRARKKKNLTPEQNIQMWERIYKAAMLQKELIEHVRFLERIHAGKLQLPIAPVLLSDVLDKVIFLFETPLSEKQMSLKTTWENNDASIKVLAEPISLLNNVLSNLISNAIKFSNDHSSIFIDIKEKDNKVHVAVRDQGIGMPESIRTDLFYMDRATSRSGTKGESGSGFGMPLALAYMRRYGGTVEVTSRDIDTFPSDHGTTMTLIFDKPNIR